MITDRNANVALTDPDNDPTWKKFKEKFWESSGIKGNSEDLLKALKEKMTDLPAEAHIDLLMQLGVKTWKNNVRC